MAQLTNEILASIAHDFYLGKLNIGEISRKYNLSRYLITKALDEAIAKGIVKISIQEQIQRDQKMERLFQKKFNLKEAIVLRNSSTTNQDNEKIIAYAAKQIESYLQTAHIIGISWGTLVSDIINHFDSSQRNDLNCVQLVGENIHSEIRKSPLEQKLAQHFHAHALTLPAPIYVLQSDFLNLIKQEPFYQTLVPYYKKLDLIFAGLGTYQAIEANPYLENKYAPTLFGSEAKNKIAGLIFGRPYNIDGQFEPNVENHICGISLKQLKKVPIRFVIVKNRFKSEALLGALRSGIITHLITNDGIAARVLQAAKQNS